MKVLLSGFIFLSLFILTSCGSSNSSTSVGVQKISEFTAFDPKTGQPLKPEDLSAELFKQDFNPDGNDETPEPQDIGNVDEVLKRAKDSMLMGWTPTGEYNSYLSPECHYENLQKILGQSNKYTSDLANHLQDWEKNCEDELSRGHTNNLATVLQFSNVKYDMLQNNIQKLKFTFDDHHIAKGLLAMKQGRRPLVIFISGIYGDAEDGGVLRNFFMHLYEESPFHVLMMGSITGEEYMRDNHEIALGGFDQGKQIVEIAKMLTDDPEYRDQITDIHVVGVSLGSNSVLFSSLYNSYVQDGPSKIKSAMAFCPVVNLEPTMKSVFQPSVRGAFYYILTNQVIRDTYNDVPSLQNVLNINEIWSQNTLYNALTSAVATTYQRRTDQNPWDASPFNGVQIHSIDDVWKLNNFVNYVDKVTTPTLVVYAHDDFLVKPDVNSVTIFDKTHNINSNVGVLQFQNGSHCAFNVAESWPTISTMVRGFVLKHSSYVSSDLQEMVLPLNTQNVKLTKNQKIMSYKFQAVKNKTTADVVVQYFDSFNSYAGRSCNLFDPVNAPDECYNKKTVKMNLGNYLQDIGLKVPQSDFETQRLTRWLNTHATLLNSNSNIVLEQNLWPQQVRFHGRFEF